MSNQTTNFLIYNLPDEKLSVDIIVKDETIWISQKGLSELFGIDRTGIGKHLKNIFSDGELDEKVVCANFAHTTFSQDLVIYFWLSHILSSFAITLVLTFTAKKLLIKKIPKLLLFIFKPFNNFINRTSKFVYL